MTIAKLGKGNQKRKYRNIYRHVFYRKLVEQSKAKSNGYQFVKGKSRSKSVSDAESDGSATKRAKLSSEERSRKIKLLRENLQTLTNRLGFKARQLDKERCIRNFKQCDTISGEMMEIRKERASLERQLSALMKKEGKAEWYKKKSTKKIKKAKIQLQTPREKFHFY
jgi:hypothetical protein